MRTKRTFLFFLCIIPVYFFGFPPQALPKKDHLVYFPNTAYELNIYKIYGKQPGKTLMLIGGIQGNEPGGFLSADLYADMSLEVGNLIVVPRANFYSIILNQRGAHGDMNRKFTHEEISASMEDKIVTILKELISQSDYLLNLHDGTGYYYPTYLNKWRNPMCFGQTIIADCETYRIPGTDRVIKLGEMARRVIRDVNPHIKNDLYEFRFMDTKTGEKNSPHREQLRSATYYALTKHHIPAFGVETSKFLPSIDLKVRYHNLVINAFKKLFGIIPESPGLVLDPPVMKYLVVSINGRTPIVVNNSQTLKLFSGDSINVSHIEANYERGLSLDILGYGGLNDYRKDFAIFRDTNIIVRKDNHILAEIPVKTDGQRPDEGRDLGTPKKITDFIIETKGQRILLSSGETFEIVKGETMKIVDILPPLPGAADVKVNFKGFVGETKGNTGEDRGYVIDTFKDIMKRYALDEKGDLYEILALQGDHILGRLMVRLVSPKLDYLLLKVNDERRLLLRSGDTISLLGEDKICLEEIWTNLSSKKDIHLNINGHDIYPTEVKRIKEICPSNKQHRHEVEVKKGPLLLGRIFITLIE
ncbi:MAG: M99 family carboxypeptidase catalytic domain-containing protein [Pseudomonadota bacterium]